MTTAPSCAVDSNDPKSSSKLYVGTRNDSAEIKLPLPIHDDGLLSWCLRDSDTPDECLDDAPSCSLCRESVRCDDENDKAELRNDADECDDMLDSNAVCNAAVDRAAANDDPNADGYGKGIGGDGDRSSPWDDRDE